MSVDVLVVGGGVAGLSAAIAAADGGAQVELLDAASFLGGAALLSNGSLWGFEDIDSYLEHCPGAEPLLAKRMVAGLTGTVKWLVDKDVEVGSRGPSLYGAERSFQIKPLQLVDRLKDALVGRVRVTTDARVSAFRSITGGVHVTTASGRELSARNIVLATGGIHADALMLTEAGLHQYVDLPVRNRSVSGDGLRLALDNGAKIAGTAEGIYGHLVPTGLATEDVASPLAAQYQSYAGVLIGFDGSLLASPGTDDHNQNRIVTRQPARRAVLFFDASAAPPRIRSAVGGTSWARDRIAFAQSHGDRVASLGTLDELRSAVREWGLDTLSVESTAALAQALTEAPLTAVEVEPSITHAGAGVRVDASLRASGLMNVFIAGADIGNGFGDGYGGGLLFALTTGIAAGREAATAEMHPDHVDSRTIL